MEGIDTQLRCHRVENGGSNDGTRDVVHNHADQQQNDVYKQQSLPQLHLTRYKICQVKGRALINQYLAQEEQRGNHEDQRSDQLTRAYGGVVEALKIHSPVSKKRQ